MDGQEQKTVENKLLLLYLVDKMDLPLSRSLITEYVLQSDFMDYLTLSQTLADMSDEGYLEKTSENNITRYSITEEGQTALEYFDKQLPYAVRGRINSYVNDNRRNLKREYENTATYFYNDENTEFRVKCGVYEDERVLMELIISVDTKEQAKIISTNWKNNAKTLYGKIIEDLVIAP
jgi:DNA-binding PadR family transcriptional regulator